LSSLCCLDGFDMARSNVISEFARRALWLYIAEAAAVLAILVIIRTHT
jgi:hypothetical protein